MKSATASACRLLVEKAGALLRPSLPAIGLAPLAGESQRARPRLHLWLAKLGGLAWNGALLVWHLAGVDPDRRRLMWGKLRRGFQSYVRGRRYVAKKLESRRGECHRCGVCCQLGFPCVHLDQVTKLCTVNECKPTLCQDYPLDERDLADRVLIGTRIPCGFYFVREGESDEEARARARAIVIGPDGKPLVQPSAKRTSPVAPPSAEARPIPPRA